MKITPIKPTEAFSLSLDEQRSFRGAPTPCRISGPPGLVRLVQNGRRAVGAFWFEEPVFTRLREKARLDLAAQNPGNKEPFSIPMKDMVGLYMKHCLRSDLAICKNWTADFDSYAVLPLRPVDSLVAWVGKIADQPYYSPPSHGTLSKKEYQDQMAIHDRAEAGGIRLLATENQYVIHFDHPANRPFESRIMGPWEF